MTKQELRNHIRSLKKSFSKEELASMSEQISCNLLSEEKVLEADTILAYFPLPDEVDVTPVIDTLVSQGKTVLLPKVTTDTDMVLYEYHSKEDLKEGRYGILEPFGKEFCEHDKIATAIIPGMAFSEKGVRLGRGKGYYDRFLARVKEKKGSLPFLIGVAFPFQIIEEIPTNEYDVCMNKVIKL